MKPLTIHSPDRTVWDDEVYTALELNGDMTRSDAQGFADAWLELPGAQAAYEAGCDALTYADALLTAGVQP